MSLFQNAANDPREHYAAVLAFYGALGDAACGNPRGFSAKKAAAAVSFARYVGLDDATCDALAFAGTLHAIGAIGTAPSDRWDVPVYGARRCAEIPAVPRATAEFVRAQSECWDGTGFPDQLRWDAVAFAAQLLLLADIVSRANDAEDALDCVNAESGRSLSPRVARLFGDWLRAGQTVGDARLPAHALDVAVCDAASLFERIIVLVEEARR